MFCSGRIPPHPEIVSIMSETEQTSNRPEEYVHLRHSAQVLAPALAVLARRERDPSAAMPNDNGGSGDSQMGRL